MLHADLVHSNEMSRKVNYFVKWTLFDHTGGGDGGLGGMLKINVSMLKFNLHVAMK